MPKVIQTDLRKVILKIREYFVQEKQNGGPLLPVKKVHERVAAATGISIHTVSNIVKEGKNNQFLQPGKNRKVRKDKFVMDSSCEEALRRKINELNMKKEVPTLRKLHNALKEEIGFKGSKEILRRNLKLIGYTLQSKGPPKNWSRNELMDWLRERKIHFSSDMNRTQLMEIMKRNKPEPAPKTTPKKPPVPPVNHAVNVPVNSNDSSEGLQQGIAHKVATALHHFPPYHCDLNPITMADHFMTHAHTTGALQMPQYGPSSWAPNKTGQLGVGMNPNPS